DQSATGITVCSLLKSLTASIQCDVRLVILRYLKKHQLDRRQFRLNFGSTTISISDGLTRRQRSSTSATRSLSPFAGQRSVNGDPPSPIHLSPHSVIARNGKPSAVPIFVNGYSMRVRRPSSRYLRLAMIPLSTRPASRFERTLRGMSRSA